MLSEQLNRIEKITVQTASKVVALSNVSGDVPTALIEIQSKLSDLLLVENNRLRDEILQNLPINDDMALNEFEAKLIDPKFRSAFVSLHHLLFSSHFLINSCFHSLLPSNYVKYLSNQTSLCVIKISIDETEEFLEKINCLKKMTIVEELSKKHFQLFSNFSCTNRLVSW